MLRHCSIIVCTAVSVLVVLGLVMLTSTGAWVKGFDEYHFLYRQLEMLGVGLVAAFVAAIFPLESLRRWSPWFLGIACVALILCYVPGISEPQYGSNRWIKFPVIGQFQPSEAAKIVIMLSLATWFARWQTEVHTFWRGFVLPGAIAGVPIVLIACETDVGTALSLSMAVGAVFFCVGTRLIYMVPTAVLLGSGAVYYILHDAVRRSRIDAWLDLENPIHQLNKGMQQWRALLALGNGGPWGVGLGNGVEKFGTLTFAHIDFIFPVIGEELGLPFTMGVVMCYVLIAVGGCGIALQANNVFHRCLALGITCVIVLPAIQNIGVTTALLPNDGLPLPFVSYGGTSLVFSLAAVGMLVGIHRKSQLRAAQEFPLTRQTRLAVRL
ncbi:MAG: FtsW/RodA/SpoVE family cell cycle protein [Akkermansiaceae bacterium]|jgi:cell division protein FtsW|nr:FtsW/RodA/SpoVE family cell cycle protein [Akkermansiaceae bacterium]